MSLEAHYVALDKSKHAIKSFDCGVQSMNRYLARFAVNHQKKRLNATFVLPTDEKINGKLQIGAYYTLANSTVYKQMLPVKTSLPDYSIPVILLARLAVSKSLQGQSIGSKSLVYALRHAYRLNESGLPSLGLVLDVLNDDALRFYNQFDFFKVMSEEPKRLFVSMNSLADL